MEESNIKYLEAKKRVKRIKGFYIHALVFILVNAFLVFINVYVNQNEGGPKIKISQFLTIILWGLGLIVHGLSVFLPNFIFGSDWEEKKIRELMEKEKNLKNVNS